jgi:hypothetical protein
MPRRKASFDTVRRAALDLAGVEQSTMYGAPALKFRGKLLACMASHKSAEPGTLVVKIGSEERDALIADDPDTYYVKPHYEGYGVVLVRLALIETDALRDLLQSAWRRVSASAMPRPRHHTGSRHS